MIFPSISSSSISIDLLNLPSGSLIPMDMQSSIMSLTREERMKRLPPIERPKTRNFNDKSTRSSSSSPLPSPSFAGAAAAPKPGSDPTAGAGAGATTTTATGQSVKPAVGDGQAPAAKKLRLHEAEVQTTSYDLYKMQLRTERQPLVDMAQQAQKSMTTMDWSVAIRSSLSLKILQRVEELKTESKWSLRQPKKFVAPIRPKTSWDFLLDEAKWMALDFRQERKWKIAMAYAVSQEVKAWHQRRNAKQATAHSASPLLVTAFHDTKASAVDPNQLFVPFSCDGYLDDVDVVPITPVSRLTCVRLLFHDITPEHNLGVPTKPDGYFLDIASKKQSIFFVEDRPEPKPAALTLNASANVRNRPLLSWTVDEDDILLKQAKLSHNNWVYIAEYLNTKITDKSMKKTLWDCASRFDHLKNSSSAKPHKSRRDETKRRAARHAHFFEGLAKYLKRRDHQKQRQEKSAEDGPTITKVNLTSHISHQAIAARAGVDTNLYKTPLDLNDRRMKLLKQAEANKLNAAGQAQAGMLSARSQFRPAAPGSPPSANATNTPARPNAGPVVRPAGPPMTMTQAQVQNFLRQQAMYRGSPPVPGQGLLLFIVNNI